ncbi:hypothetical protein PRZ48_002631 [Zasmidium cellare]|uniref:DUF7605 domain-containing protein n=1 Tax=Zasmidium cellare TaxID=395010 RepID=A0ABR0ETS3_ZASCE|nr:hypothetical protein PRZ48_002631 [Zasmidium cellare]
MASLPPGATAKRPFPSDDDFKQEDDDIASVSSDGLFVSQPNQEQALDSDADDTADRASANGDSDDDSDDDEDVGYSELSEPLPHFAAYDPKVAGIKQRLFSIAKHADEILCGNSCSTEEVAKLRRKTTQVLKAPEGEREMIGLVGNAGQGKSSFVNTISDRPRLAKALDIGKSVTYVVMVYQKASDDQRLPFSARVEYFDLATIGKLLEEAIADWQAFYFDEQDGWSNDERKYRKDRARTTLSIFQALFRQMDEFSTLEKAKENLHKICRTNSTPGRKVAMLVEQVEKVMSQHFPPGKYEAYHEANTQDELRELLDPALREDDDGEEEVLWPLVKKVIIGVRGSRVLDRWSIADLPGLTDTHKVRVDATLNHINECNDLFVCARLGRIVTNPNVHDLAQKYGHAFQNKLSIIATKCDENIGPEEVRDLARKQSKLKKAEAQWKQTTTAIKGQIKYLESRKKKSKKSENPSGRLQEIADLSATRKKLDDEWWEKVVEARNSQVTPQLQREIQQHLPADSHLPVFCVSNTHYEALKDESLQDAKFQLSAQGTGVPGLRRHLLALAAPPEFQTLLNFIDHEFTVFMGGCELWAGNGLVEGRAQLISVIKQPLELIPGMFAECLSDIQDEASIVVLDPLRNNQSSFAGLATAVVTDNLAKRHWATVQAFIRRYGNHSTSSMQESWNELFTAAVRLFLNENWATFAKSAKARMLALETQTLATVSSIMQLLDREEAALSLPTEPFGKSLEARVEGLRQNFRTAEQTLSQGLRTVLLHATVDGPRNYFAGAMQKAYELCQEEKGTGVKARCIGILKGHISLQSPFAKMFDSMQQGINEVYEPVMSNLQDKVKETFENIEEDFASMIRDKKQSAAEAPIRQEIKAWLPEAKAEFAAIKNDVKKLQARYPQEA